MRQGATQCSGMPVANIGSDQAVVSDSFKFLNSCRDKTTSWRWERQRQRERERERERERKREGGDGDE